MATLAEMHRHGGKWVKHRKNKNPLGYNVPFMKGVVIRPVIRKPKKPNSANRKCVLVKLSNGKETVAYVPKEGHNLQVKLGYFGLGLLKPVTRTYQNVFLFSGTQHRACPSWKIERLSWC